MVGGWAVDECVMRRRPVHEAQRFEDTPFAAVRCWCGGERSGRAVKKWKVLVIAAMVVGLLLAVAGAVAMAGTGSTRETAVLGPGMMRQSGAGSAGQGVWGGMMLRGSGNGQLSSQMDKLMQEHIKDMAAWQQKYGGDPTSAAALNALQHLRA
jgi:hypothetical protein